MLFACDQLKNAAVFLRKRALILKGLKSDSKSTNTKRVSEKGTLFFYVKVRTFPSSDFLICSKMFILEHVNR